MKIFKQKKVKIENFELQKRYIPQNKAENIYNSVSAQKRKNFAKKKFFFKFFWFSRHARGPPEIFDVQFFKNFQKKSKNGFTGVYQTLKGTKSWILVNLPQILWKWRTVFDRPGHNGLPLPEMRLKMTFCFYWDMTHYSGLKNLWNVFCLWIFSKKLRISNFEMWSWDVIFVPFSEKSPVSFRRPAFCVA